MGMTCDDGSVGCFTGTHWAETGQATPSTLRYYGRLKQVMSETNQTLLLQLDSPQDDQRKEEYKGFLHKVSFYNTQIPYYYHISGNSIQQYRGTDRLNIGSLYDLREVKSLDISYENMTITIQFSLLDQLKFQMKSSTECQQLYHFLESKIQEQQQQRQQNNNNSSSELTTFNSFLKLEIYDQERWMNILINNLLEPLFLPNGNYFISQICQHAFEELLTLCDSCSLAIVSKKPQVSTRSR
jgi:hypothetical protein